MVLQSLDPSTDVILKENEMRRNLNEWMERAENMWRQKSKELWLKAGDWNSKFFHASTIANIRRIFIATMKNEDGQWFEARESIGNYLCSQFSDLFKAEDNI